MGLSSIWHAGIEWLLPCYCAGCGKERVQPKKPICYACLSDLTESVHDQEKQQAIQEIFWGRIPLQSVITPFPLRSGSVLQHSIHQLKYHHRPTVGNFLGKLATHHWHLDSDNHSFDALIPLPLHHSKKRKRGYNQAERICAGIAEGINLPIWNDLVIRNQVTETQTKKDRGQRWKNMQGKFKLQNSTRAIGKHLLLVDDVLTTGATLEACGQTLLQTPDLQLSIFALGLTENG